MRLLTAMAFSLLVTCVFLATAPHALAGRWGRLEDYKDPGKGLDLHNIQKDITCPKDEELKDIEMWIEHLEHLQLMTVEDEYYDSFVERVKKVMKDYADKIAKKNHCAAMEDDIYCMLRLTELMQKLGVDEGGSAILSWTQRAFRAIAADATTLTSRTGREILAKQAMLLGLGTVSDQILAGKKISTDCVLEWRVKADISYTCTVAGVKCAWQTTINFPKVMLTGWRSRLGGLLPPLSNRQDYTTSQTVKKKYAYYDGENWISCNIGKSLVWQTNIETPQDYDKPLGATGKLPLSLNINPIRSKAVSKCSDGTGGTLMGIAEAQGPWYIPVNKVADGKTFSVSDKRTDDDGYVKVKLTFSPAQ